MVQILPPKTNLGSELGQALGQGLESGMSRSLQNEYNRHFIQKGLNELENIASQPGKVDPIQLATKMMGALAYIPGSERYFGQLFPMLLQQLSMRDENTSKAQGQGEAPPSILDDLVGQATTQGPAAGAQPQGMASKAAAPKDVESQVREMVKNGELEAPMRSLFGSQAGIWDPTSQQQFMGFSPDQIARQEELDLKKGLQSSPKANFMRQYNAELDKNLDRELARVKTLQDLQQTQLQSQKAFEGYLDAARPGLPVDDRRVFLDFSRTPEALKQKTLPDRYKVARDLYDRYQSLKNKITDMAPFQFIGGNRDRQIRDIHNVVKPMVELGQRDEAKKLLMEHLDLGDSMSEEAINPLTPQQRNDLNRLDPLKSLQDALIDYDSEDAFGFNRQYSPRLKAKEKEFDQAFKERKMGIQKIENQMKKVIQPGTPQKPGPSLLVIRDHVMDNLGMTWEEYRDMINNLVEQGSVELDPYQQQELPKINQRPYPGLGDAIFNKR